FPQVILTNVDLAMTAAIASSSPGRLHLHCLWHVFKNIFNTCSPQLANNYYRADVMRCFRNAASNTPEVRWNSLV
ncbi:unnamed protein product, partial [Ectocarpus fasciculatus]